MNPSKKNSYLLYPLPIEKNSEKFHISIEVDSAIVIKYNSDLIGTLQPQFTNFQSIWLGNCLIIENKYKTSELSEIRILTTVNFIYIKNFSHVKQIWTKEPSIIAKFKLQIFHTHHFTVISLNGGKPFLPEIHKAKYHHLWKSATHWLKEIPKNSNFIDSPLWNINWLLQRAHKNRLDLCLHRIKQLFPLFGERRDFYRYDLKDTCLWNKLHLVDDLMWYSTKIAENLLNEIEDYFDESTYMIRMYRDQNRNIACPPIWSFFILELAKYTGDFEKFIPLYEISKKNLSWWESHRFYQKYGLFGDNATVTELEMGSTLSNTPRFRFQISENSNEPQKLENTKTRSLLLIDLNAQMCDYYQNMGVLALIFQEEELGTEYFDKAYLLQEKAREFLWDEEKQYYFDYDVELKQLQPIKTIACFWPLYGGLATKKKAEMLKNHILNHDEFWSDHPIATISQDVQKSLGWKGENYNSFQSLLWIIIGLERYSYYDVATEIAKLNLEYLSESFNLVGNLYEIYPIYEFNPERLTNNHVVSSMILGYSCYHPIHSLFYRGVAGVEVLENSLNFVMSSDLNKDLNFSFNYRGVKQKTYLSKLNQKISVIHP